MPITYMTKSGYKKKMEEIAYLESVKRPEISRAIAEARDKGDLSENSEYDAAKEATCLRRAATMSGALLNMSLIARRAP